MQGVTIQFVENISLETDLENWRQKVKEKEREKQEVLGVLDAPSSL